MESKNLKVCLAPMTIAWDDKLTNIKQLKKLIEKVHPETDVLILPETFSTGFPTGLSIEKVQICAEDFEGETISILKGLARDNNLALAGSMVIRDNGNLYNRVFFIEPSGELSFADKAHLFRMGGENEIFTPGSKRLAVRFRGWNISMIVCYDLRFPVWCRNVNNEYDLLIVVANWPKVRNNVWDTLLKARAIENLAYVCGVNCTGEDLKGNDYDGLSAVYDFKGKNIGVYTPSQLIYCELRKEQLDNFREKFPVWMDADKFIIQKNILEL